MINILKYLTYILLRPISYFSVNKSKVIVFSSANFGFNGQARSNYKYACDLFGVENVIFLNASGIGFGIPLKSILGLKYILFSKKYITDGVLPFFISMSTKEVIQTWHGIPIKSIGVFEKRKNSYLERRLLSWLWYNQWSQYVAILSPSESYSKIIQESFLQGKKTPNIYQCMLPQQLNLLKRYPRIIQVDSRIKSILYAPTYRCEKARSWDLLVNHDFIKFCEKNDIKIIVKYHPLDRVTKKVECINVFYSQNEDIYELLDTADLIITDYSSLIFDCVLLNKNISLYCLDKDAYRTKRGFANEDGLNKFNVVTESNNYLHLFNYTRRNIKYDFTEVEPVHIFKMIGWL